MDYVGFSRGIRSICRTGYELSDHPQTEKAAILVHPLYPCKNRPLRIEPTESFLKIVINSTTEFKLRNQINFTYTAILNFTELEFLLRPRKAKGKGIQYLSPFLSLRFCIPFSPVSFLSSFVSFFKPLVIPILVPGLHLVLSYYYFLSHKISTPTSE